MPITTVTMQPPGSRPGSRTLAINPANNPKTIHASRDIRSPFRRARDAPRRARFRARAVPGTIVKRRVSAIGGRGRGQRLDDLLHPPDLAAREADLDAVRVERRAGQDLRHDAARSLARTLMALQDDLHLEARTDVLSHSTCHRCHCSPAMNLSS